MAPRSATTAPTPRRAAVQAGVLRATEELLSERVTFAELNIERIATRAGISRTAFYFYFADKRELLMHLTEDVTEQLYAQADIWYSGSGDPEREIRQALGNIAELYGEHGALLRAIVEVSAYDEEVAVFWRGLMGRFVTATKLRIEAEQREGRVAALPAEATAFALCWMAERTLYQELVQETPIAPGDLVDALVGIWMGSIYSGGLDRGRPPRGGR